jgi:hypothetical protein
MVRNPVSAEFESSRNGVGDMSSFSTNSMLSMAPPRRIYMMHGINSKNFGSNSTYLGALGDDAATTSETSSVSQPMPESHKPYYSFMFGMLAGVISTAVIVKLAKR